MRTISATEASRGFSALIDAVARGEEVTITRAGQPVAEMHPVRTRTVRDLRLRLAAIQPLDEAFEPDIAKALDSVTHDAVEDPWRDG